MTSVAFVHLPDGRTDRALHGLFVRHSRPISGEHEDRNVPQRLCSGCRRVEEFTRGTFRFSGQHRSTRQSTPRRCRPAAAQRGGDTRALYMALSKGSRLLVEALGLHRTLRRLGMMEDAGTWDHDQERAVDFLVGACLRPRMDSVAKVRGFDEESWLYGEEADLRQRLTARGWHVFFTPAALATHVGGASSNISRARLRNPYSGQQRFLRKHRTPISWPFARVALLIGSAARGRWGGFRVALGLQV